MSFVAAYEFQHRDETLGSLVVTGSIVQVDPLSELRPLDVVAVVRESGAECKIYLGDRQTPEGETLCILAQTNPPLILPVKATEIRAMHRCPELGIAGATEAEIEPLLPFVADSDLRPAINPTWHPWAES
ncbi:hypothetical protein ACWGTO_07590 [Mesorhizobium sp. PL10]